MTTPDRPILRIHAGTHKTGTSTLQAVMKAKSDLADPGFLYPVTGRMAAWPLAHHDLIRSLSAGNLSVLDQLRAEIEEGRFRIGVISCEDFSLPSSFFAINLLVDRLPDVDIELHTAFRPYMSFAQSYYLEQVKRDVTQWKPYEFVRETINSYRYSTIINFFESTRLRTFYYEYSAPNFMAQIYRALTGLDLDSKSAGQYHNRAYSYEMTMLLRSVYRQNQGKVFDIDKILHAAWQLEQHLGFIDSKRSLMRHAEAVALNDFLSGERTFMRARFGDMADRLYPQIKAYDDSDVLDPDDNFAQRLIDGYFARFMQ
jgi:hypothetical protein